MRSVCWRSLSMSMFSMRQLRTISVAAFSGMIPRRACTFASADSISRYLAVRFSSDHTRRIASVPKMLPKMDESMREAGMAVPCDGAESDGGDSDGFLLVKPGDAVCRVPEFGEDGIGVLAQGR